MGTNHGAGTRQVRGQVSVECAQEIERRAAAAGMSANKLVGQLIAQALSHDFQQSKLETAQALNQMAEQVAERIERLASVELVADPLPAPEVEPPDPRQAKAEARLAKALAACDAARPAMEGCTFETCEEERWIEPLKKRSRAVEELRLALKYAFRHIPDFSDAWLTETQPMNVSACTLEMYVPKAWQPAS